MWVKTLLILFLTLNANCDVHKTFENVTITFLDKSGNKFNLFVSSGETLKQFLNNGDSPEIVKITNQYVPKLLEGSFADFTTQVLDLSSNQIEKIEPGAFKNLGLLRALNLTDNRLTAIPAGIFTKLDAESLLFGRNEIYRIADCAFCDLTHLTLLDLRANRLRRWNSRWLDNTPVESVNFSFNQLVELPEGAFEFYDRLNLRNRRIMRVLNFSHNRISKICRSALPRLHELRALDLSYNNLETVEVGAFDVVEFIEMLDLSNNLLVSLDREVFARTRVNFLNLERNFLYVVDVNLGNVVNLRGNLLRRDVLDEWLDKEKMREDLDKILWFKRCFRFYNL